MSKVDEAIELLEQKQNRTPKEESGLRELKILSQSAIRDNAEQTAQADAYYRTSWENYRIQDEMLREFFR